MNERGQDVELLRQFVRRGDQAAFATVVRRHVDLVYATALRQVEDQGAAEEVAQNVFAAMARKAWRFAADDSVAAWLYRTTVLEAKSWLRGELRRRRREQTAAELGTTMKTPDEQPALRALVPLLDEALLSLREKDRTALLLRYYESQSLREVAAAIGIREDAAQKRVTSALEKLATFFQRSGFRTATSAATVATLQYTAVEAPAVVVNTLLQAATQAGPPAFFGLAALTRWVGMTKGQAASLCMVLALAPVGMQWHEASAAAKRASSAREQLEKSQSWQRQLLTDVERLHREAERLERGALVAAQIQRENENVARRVVELRERLGRLANSPEPQWADDLPFARIPTWAVTNLNFVRRLPPPRRDSQVAAFDAFGKLSTWAEEILGLSPEYKTALEGCLASYLQDLNNLAATTCYETNLWPPLSQPSSEQIEQKVIVVPELGTEGWRARERFSSNLREAIRNEKSLLRFASIYSHEIFWDRLLISPSYFRVRIIGSGDMVRLDLPPSLDAADLPRFLKERLDPWFSERGVPPSLFTRWP